MANYTVIQFILKHMKDNVSDRQYLEIGDTLTYNEVSDKKSDINNVRLHLDLFYDFKEYPGATPLETIFSITGLKEDYNKK